MTTAISPAGGLLLIAGTFDDLFLTVFQALTARSRSQTGELARYVAAAEPFLFGSRGVATTTTGCYIASLTARHRTEPTEPVGP